MKHYRILSLALALLMVVGVFAVPAFAEGERLPQTILYKRTGADASSVTSSVAWNLKDKEVFVYEQPYNKNVSPWLLAFLATGSGKYGSALEARLGYDGINSNRDLILADNPYITDGKIKTLVVTDNKGYQHTPDQYTYTFQVVNRQLKRVNCSKVEAGLYGVNVKRTNSWVTYDYDADGRVTTITHSDGRTDTFTYDETGRLVSFKVDQLTLKPQYSGTDMVPVNQTNKVVYTRAYGNIVSIVNELPGVFKETYRISEYQTGELPCVK